MLTSALGWLAAALSMSLLWPQVYLSCVKRRTDGMSAVATWLGAALPVCWITYGTLLGDRIQVTTNVVTGIAGTALLAAILITQPSLRTRRSLAVSGGSALTMLAAAAAAVLAARIPGVGPATAAGALGSALAVVGILSNIPQPLALLRDRTQDLSGLSPVRWWMSAASAALWAAYGLSLGQPAVWSGALWGLLTALVVCTVLVRGPRNAAVDGALAGAADVVAAGSVVAALPHHGARGIAPVAGHLHLPRMDETHQFAAIA